ncbi:MAG: cyclic nucleotide-binding domain-containing protein [Betaproteobacteria bacterium]|nr:cyclic nucleotide-binding domain-containing protein [Betaproteobacteria bacterium]
MLQNPNLPSSKTSCFSCSLREFCLPAELEEDEINSINFLINRSCKTRRGGYLYRSGMDFQSLYIVRSGFFKTYVLDEDGREQVTGFHMPGEMLGLEAISTNVHTCHTVALKDSETCEIHFTRLEEIGSYLGLKLETVSCAFSKLQNDGLIKINSKSVQLNNISWLKQSKLGNYNVAKEIIEGTELQ